MPGKAAVHSEEALGEVPAEPHHEAEDERKPNLALAIGPETVPGQTGLEPDEPSNHASPSLVSSLPTATMKASSTDSTPIRVQSS